MNNILNNKTTRKTTALYSAIIINILLGWLITKLNTHYLTVVEYGQYAFFIIVIYYSRVFFSLGTFESASRLLALEKNNDLKHQHFGASIICALILIIPFTIFIFIFSGFSDSLFEVKIGMLYIQNLPLIGFVLLQSLLIATLRGSGNIRILSFFTFSPRFFYLVLLGILLIYNRFTLSNTLFTFFTGLILSIILIFIIIKPSLTNLKSHIRKIIDETKRYGIHIYFGSIMHETLFHSDKLLISYFLSATEMAYYGLAYMLTFPLSHFSTSLSTTLFNKFASQEKINKKVLKINFLYIFISVSIFVLLREPIIRYLFSENYLPAVDVMLPLAIAFGFSGLSKPFTLYLMAQGFGKIVRNISIAIPIINVTLNIILIPIWGILGAAWSAFAAYGLDLFLYYIFYQKTTKHG